MSRGQILLHCCCGPCALACIDRLRQVGFEPVACFLNPNIHPSLEYLARRESFSQAMDVKNVPIADISQYGLHEFFKRTEEFATNRCLACYRMRLTATAQLAKNLGINIFTTTLLISPYQNFAGIVTEGRLAAEAGGCEFLDIDFRELFRDGQNLAREMGLYMQKYCGCIFSEEERYKKKCELKA
jgi:hypothetical protein